MKKFIALLLALVICVLPAVARAELPWFAVGNDGWVYVDGMFYYLEKGVGLCRYDGTERTVLHEFNCVPEYGLATDGSLFYALEFYEGCCFLVEVNLPEATCKDAAELHANAIGLVALSEDEVYYLVDTQEGAPDLCCQELGSLADTVNPLLGNIGNTMAWYNIGVIQYHRNDPVPGELMAVMEDSEGEMSYFGIDPVTLTAAVHGDTIYYWTTDAEEPGGDYGFIELRASNLSDVYPITGLVCGENGGAPDVILKDYSVFTMYDPYRVHIVSFETHDVGYTEDENILGREFCEDEVTRKLYYFDQSEGDLSASDLYGKLSFVANLGAGCELRTIAGGVAYVHDPDTGKTTAVKIGESASGGVTSAGGLRLKSLGTSSSIGAAKSSDSIEAAESPDPTEAPKASGGMKLKSLN